MLVDRKVEIRDANAADSEAVRHVHRIAFRRETEADLVERLVGDGDSVISIVATDQEGLVVGHILLSRMRVLADGRALEALGLAPVAVLPERQRQGIGSALIEAGLREARELQTDIVFVLGEPDYYGRFGFSAEAARPFASPYAGPYFQAQVLSELDMVPIQGSAEYAPAFAGCE